jgi:hypothetical protein
MTAGRRHHSGRKRRSPSPRKEGVSGLDEFGIPDYSTESLVESMDQLNASILSGRPIAASTPAPEAEAKKRNLTLPRFMPWRFKTGKRATMEESLEKRKALCPYSSKDSGIPLLHSLLNKSCEEMALNILIVAPCPCHSHTGFTPVIDQVGRSALHYAVAGGSIACVQRILELLGDETRYYGLLQDSSGLNTLHIVCGEAKWRPKAVRWLMQSIGIEKSEAEAATDPALLAKDANGMTILHHAAIKCGHWDTVEYLAKLRPDLLTTPDVMGRLPIHLCRGPESEQMMEVLLDAGCLPESTDYDGNNALHWAVRQGSNSLIEALVQLKQISKLMMPNHAGETPLHVAALCNNGSAARTFIRRGIAKIYALDKNGETAIVVAGRSQSHDVLRVLARKSLTK